jgi:hypothetical protein
MDRLVGRIVVEGEQGLLVRGELRHGLRPLGEVADDAFSARPACSLSSASQISRRARRAWAAPRRGGAERPRRSVRPRPLSNAVPTL